uniref:Uncharacterized protein n=1 Tax=Arundo donax TaxID=35708 RepID=A0A0A8ZQE2_ARUDO
MRSIATLFFLSLRVGCPPVRLVCLGYHVVSWRYRVLIWICKRSSKVFGAGWIKNKGQIQC